MAHMIPSNTPAKFEKNSLENQIYQALSTLSDEYWVVHSYKMVGVNHEMKFYEKEIDFVVFNKKLGILVIEAKAGNIQTKNGEWYYGNGERIPNGGPYRHAADIKWAISKRFKDMNLKDLLKRCKLMHAVWFPSLRADELGKLEYSAEASRDITLCKTDFNNPEPMIKKIMGLEIEANARISTQLHDNEVEEILDKVIRPQFNIVATGIIDYGYSDFVFNQLLDEQIRVLDFLYEQQTATINGAAGTGKTVVAITHAKKLAQHDQVLFLCYNKLLQESIKKRCSDNRNIAVYTIAAFATKIAGSIDYRLMKEQVTKDKDVHFPYKHVVIDEGQDFGIEDIEQAEILKWLRDLVDEKNGTFYFFYDKRQLIQGVSMPECITDADCKLTLYRNCRNTENIARCSFKALNDNSGKKVMLSTEAGNVPEMQASKNLNILVDYIDSEIKKLRANGIEDIVLLTCKTIDRSAFQEYFTTIRNQEYWKKTSVRVYTCRTFKGLEADAVILVDVDKSLWEKPKTKYHPKEGLLFYTGASRAKFELRIAAEIDEADCIAILKFFEEQPTENSLQKLADVLGVSLV